MTGTQVVSPPTGCLIDHLGRESSDIDSDVRAFVGVGMSLIRWGVHAVTGLRIALLHDGVASKVELIEVTEMTGALDHVAYAVDDLDRWRTIAVHAGFTEEQGRFRIEAARAWSAFVRSPSGILVQYIQYESGSSDIMPWAARE